MIRCATHRPLKNHPWRPYEGPEELNLNPERSKNVPIFAVLGDYGEKSNDFLGTSGEAAGGYPRGAHLLEAPPWTDFFGYFLVQRQESDTYHQTGNAAIN